MILRASLTILVVCAPAGAQSPRLDEVRGVLPRSHSVEQVVFVDPAARTYYLANRGELWLYDHSTAKTSRIANGIWDAAVSTKRDLIAYVRAGTDRIDHSIWLLAIDPHTGRPAGTERRLSTTLGDVPAISPGGLYIAFARDDSTGVGQSLVVVPVAGGKERILAANMPSTIRAISWTPDGRTIYFGVDLPVPCLPEWSCLRLGESQRRWGSIRRVSADGGEVGIVIPQARAVFPGLSPDGTTIVYGDVGDARRWVIADTAGTERAAITVTPQQRIQGWSGNGTLMVGEGTVQRPVRQIFAVELSPRRRP